MRRRFTFRPVLLAFAVPTFALLCSLGVWQLGRMTWKNDLREAQDRLLASAPVETSLSHPLFGLEDFHPIQATGVLDLSKAIGFFGRRLEGIQGQDFYAPLTMDDDQILWAKLGHAPDFDVTTAKTAYVQLPLGQIYMGGWRGNPAFNPGNEPERSLWAVADPVAMSTHAGLDPEFTLPMLVELVETMGDKSPFKPNPTRAGLRNPHLSYALQWFSFAAILLLFVAILSFPKRGHDT